MTRILLKFAFLAGGLFAAAIGVIRAQPYDDGGLGALLTPPEGCPAPCFMGIRPGETTVAAAAALLRRQVGIVPEPAGVHAAPNEPTGHIAWHSPRHAIGGQIHFAGGIVDEITLNLPFGHLWLLLGAPNGGEFVEELLYGDANADLVARPLYHVTFYSDYEYRVYTATSCGAFWEQNASIILFANAVPARMEAADVGTYRRRACRS